MTTREGRCANDDLYYRVWEAPSPRAVVVLAHGYAEHSGRYHHVGEALADAGFETWALDHRGHGQSVGDRADIGSLASAVGELDDFVVLAQDQHPGVPVFLLGHSMGGLIAVAYTQEHQDRLAGLIVSGPAVGPPNPMFESLLEMDEIPVINLAPLVSRDPAVVSDYETDPLNYRGPMPRALIQEFARVQEVRDRFSRIRIPVLAMHGSEDALVAPQASEDLAAGVSSDDVTLTIWPGLYHEIMNEPEKEQVIGEMAVWISKHVGEARPEGEGG